jgi:hypothetical protein
MPGAARGNMENSRSMAAIVHRGAAARDPQSNEAVVTLSREGDRRR